MFTGLVQAVAEVRALESRPFGRRLVLERHGWSPPSAPLARGDSVCVSGVCLTLVDLDPGTLAFDVIAETLACSTLGRLQPGDAVNLESCLTPASPLGGHFVQGHVDGVGRAARVLAAPQEWRLTVAPPADLMDYLTPKGSVALDGVSLTIAAVGKSDFEVALIPTTLQRTTLARLAVGDLINIEADVVAKTIVHWLRRQHEAGGGLSLEGLRRAGFVP